MDGKTLIKSLRLRNFLSYGGTSQEIPLQPLNVLIGRNASGKSNLIEAIALLHATPNDFAASIRQGGGISEWIWKGKQSIPEAEIEAVVDYPDGIMPLRYVIGFTIVGQRLEITSEQIGQNLEITSEHIEGSSADPDHRIHDFFFRSQDPIWTVTPKQAFEQKTGSSLGRTSRVLPAKDFSQERSILSQLRDPSTYPEITYLASSFGEIRLYRNASFGLYAPARVPQDTSLPDDFLLEDASNLALVLNDFEHRMGPKHEVLKRLKEFYDDVEDFSTKIRGGTVQLFLHEKGLSHGVPAMRLSDGTLRYLCLLVILCHPTPPPLMCIEEPELGLHPDILPTIAELLKEASERTQLIVTTHSDALVSALSDAPESILVCERDSEGTHLRRLEREPLKEWLEKYSLGELWRMGEIGGS